VNGRTLDWFDIDVGVRQGCVLSPLLFSVFFNGLAEAVKQTGLGVDIGVHGAARKMALLLYADDIVLTADTADDLRSLLATVDEYSRKWRFDLNNDKSEVVVYGEAKGATVDHGEFVLRTGKKLKVVQEYRYLGMEVSMNGRWSSFKNRIIARARARMRFAGVLGVHSGHVSVRAAEEVWTALICPILDWGAEVWPTKRDNIWTEAEQLQKDMMKRILGCDRSTGCEAVRGEMGWWTMHGRRIMLRLRYWGRLVRMDDTRLVKQVYQRGKKRYDEAKQGKWKNWSSYTHWLLQEVGLGDRWDEEEVEDDQETWKKLVAEKVHAYEETKWRERMAKNKKLRTYVKMKRKLTKEEYLQEPDEWQRKMLTRIRTSSSKLRIEEGRRQDKPLPVEERTCEVCSSGEVEDEAHFMLRCKRYAAAREQLEHERKQPLTTVEDALSGDMPKAGATMRYVRRAWTIRKGALAAKRELQAAESRRARAARKAAKRGE
jgi:hypothetical protein